MSHNVLNPFAMRFEVTDWERIEPRDRTRIVRAALARLWNGEVREFSTSESENSLSLWEFVSFLENAFRLESPSAERPPQLVWESANDLLRGVSENKLGTPRRTDSFYHGVSLAGELEPIVAAIRKAEYLLDLEDDWDGDGSPGYLRSTWDRGISFLLNTAQFLWARHRILIAAPLITPGPNGSIDLDWTMPGRELLLNIPVDPDAPAVYYFDDGNDNYPSEGEIRLEPAYAWLLTWVTAE